jgi:hypothetical protein
MLDVIWNDEILRNDIILDSIPNVYGFKVNGLSCESQSDGSIVDIEIWEMWYVAWINIHLVYVRIPGEGITVHRLACI